MGSYETAGGKRVSFTDEDTLRDVADLYSIVQGDYKGTPSATSTALKKMLGGLQAGRPLTDDEWAFLRRILDRNRAKLEAFRKSPANDEEGYVPLPETGTGRISEALSALPPGELRRMQEQYKTASTTTQDRNTTAPHLLDGALHDLAHAAQHGKRMSDSDVKASPESQDFNVEHMMRHIISGMDHLKRLGEHLEQHPSNPKVFKAERDTLNSMREAMDVLHPTLQAAIREASPSPPPNLREAPPHDESSALTKSTPVHECCTCKMFDVRSGRCWGYGNIKVDPDWLCDRWYEAPDWKGQIRLKRSLCGEDTETGAKIMESAVRASTLMSLREDSKPQICIDFDGVIYDRSHEPGGNNLAGKVIKGAEEGLKQLAQEFRIIILTARPNSAAVRGYLKANGLASYIADVTNIKPSAAAYVDNRALLFKNWPQIVRDLEKGAQSPFESDIPGGKT